ncbi:MAG: DinB family protein [Maribacter sp.]|nr:DinB family protein [Maribacter sp.]
MNRRLILSLIGISPLALISLKIPTNNDPILDILIKRWKKSKEYTLAVFEAMPEDDIEYRPSNEQLSFVQHFMHLSLVNNFYMGILTDSKTYKDFYALMEADFLVSRPDEINLFQPDYLEKRGSNTNKDLVSKYVADTFDYVISSLDKINDEILTKGIHKEKPEFLSGHTNLDLILRGESHTAHHRAQAIAYLRMNGIRPPGYTSNNKL